MASRGTKNPAKESEHSGTGPAHHAKMAVHSDSPPGIELDGRLTAPAGIRRLDRTAAGVWLRLTLHEGRNRQVRRMCAAVDLQVLRLLRVRVGPVLLGELRAGTHRL